MTTYTIPTLQLSNQLANSSNAGRYPVKILNSQYTPSNTMYMKHGDTVSVAVNNPASGQTQYKYIYSVNSQGGNVHAQSYPTPGNLNAYGQSQFYNNNTSRTLYWPASLVDNNTTYGPKDDTQWPFVGAPFTSGAAGGYNYSGKVRIGIATGVIYFSGGATSATIQRGSSIFVYSGASIGGLHPSANHLFADKLYVSVMTSTGTTEITSGISWNTGTQWLGFLSPTMTTTQLTVASSVAPGTYKIHLNHFSITPGNGTGRSHPDSRMSTLTLTVTAPADTTPDAFGTAANLFTSYSQRTKGTEIPSGIVTLSGTDTATSISVSGNGSPFYRTRAAGGTFGSYTNSAGSISPGHQFQFKITCSTVDSTAVSGTLNIGGVTGTITATTAAAGSTGQSGTGALPGDYGLEVRNSAGRVTFSPSRRSLNFVNASNSSISIAAGAVSNPLAAVGMTQNNSTELAVLITVPSAGTYSPAMIVTRYDNYFTIKNNSGSIVSGINWMVVRY